MCAKYQSFWVRKLTGQTRVPYNRGLRVRGSPHPLFYDADLSLPAAESNAFRNQSGLPEPDCCIASLIAFASGGVTRTENTSPLAFFMPIFGRPILLFIIIVYKNVDAKLLFVYSNVNKENDMANILKTEKKVAVVSMLAEGSSMASIARITGIHPDTIMRLAVRIGQACAKIQDEKMRGLTCKQIEVDEIWGFIGAKRKNAARAGVYGDVWTFIALDADSKLIPSFVVGKRDSYHAKAFMDDLARRLSLRVQISSDAMISYPEAVESGFGSEVDYMASL
jgi:hypothetical protein